MTLEARRTHTETAGESGGTSEGVLGTARTESDEDVLSAGVGGQLGWLGTRYVLSAKNGETSGSRGGTGFGTSTARARPAQICFLPPLLRPFIFLISHLYHLPSVHQPFPFFSAFPILRFLRVRKLFPFLRRCDLPYGSVRT